MDKIFSNKRILYLFIILIISNLLITAITIYLIYNKSFINLKAELTESVSREKTLIIGLKDKGFSNAEIATIIKDLKEKRYAIRDSGEFVIAKRVVDSIEFFVSSKKGGNLKLLFARGLGAPMFLALSGQSGFVRALDYKGVDVYAAYVWVPETEWGIVAKVPVNEFRRPYIWAMKISFAIALLLISFCVLLFIKITKPLIVKIKESEEHYKSLFENNLNVMLLIDPVTGMISDANSAACEFYNSNYNHLTSLRISELNSMTEEKLYETFQMVISGTKRNFEFKHKLPGTDIIREVEVYSGPINLKDKVYLYSIVYDITERKRIENEIAESHILLQKQNEEYASLNEEYLALNEELKSNDEELHVQNEELMKIKNILEKREVLLSESQRVARLGHYVFNIETSVWESSETLDDIFGIDSSYDKNVPGWINIIHPDYQEEMQAYLINHVIGSKLPFNKEYKIIKQDDKTERWVHGLGNLRLNAYGEPYEMFGTIQDITEKKIIENQLIEAKEKAEESDKLKTAFLQNMSHEIRTPMNAIMGFSELLEKQYDNKAKLEFYSRIIVQRCADLLDIINEILDIAKIESGQLPVKFEECKLNSLFSELSLFFNEYQSRLKKQHIKFQLFAECKAENSVIVTDKVKLKQIFINLLSNAFKFTEEGRIEAGCKLNENQELIFYVSDTGIGIPADKQSFIFERFSQIDHGINRLYSGTGLGLSIVKGLIGLLKGKIWLESEPGKGSTFYFSFPYKKLVNEVKPIEDSIKYSKSQFLDKIVLIVEDDVYNAEYLKEILTDSGFKTIHAIYGNEAVQLAQSQQIDVILMDIRLPDMDGYEVLKLIRKQNPEIKIIAQTAYATNADKEKALSAGFNDYISKPIKRDLLLKLIDNQL